MKKTFITFISILVLAVTGLKAQSLQDGIDNLYADRYQLAIDIFDKLLAVNPNNIEAIYWKGQTYFDMDDNQAARSLYEKAIQTYGNAPLLLVGLGHADLLDRKLAQARQKFETALTDSRGKKGNDPVIATAIGRANVDAKKGDYKWAEELLAEAADSYRKNPPAETLLQLGNAYRKAGEGSGGGKAYETYKKALEIYPNFAVASVRLAKLFESQKNYDLVVQNLNDALKRDPKFTPAYYELFYYYFFTKKYDEAESNLKKYIDSKLPERDINDESYWAQLCWAKGDYDCAITKDEKVVAELGLKAKPRVFKLLADAYYQKGDYANAKKNIDLYFIREKPDDFISFDYKLKADIMAKSGASDEEVYQNYIKGAELDTVLKSKIDFLKQGVQFFKDLKNREYEARMIQKIIDVKPDPTINDYFDLAIAYYFNKDYFDSRNTALLMIKKYPDEVYGYEWAYNNSIALATDTTKKIPQDSIGLPDALNLYQFSSKDTTKFKKQYINAVKYLAAYYINEAKDKEKSLEFFGKWQAADPENAESIQQFIDQIKKMPDTPKTNNPKPGSAPPPLKENSKQKTKG
jgi:tetratricopeptide (TPR) repeat protein